MRGACLCGLCRCQVKVWEWTETERQAGSRVDQGAGSQAGERGQITSRRYGAEGLGESCVSDSLQERSSSSSCSTEEFWETDLSVHRGHSCTQLLCTACTSLGSAAAHFLGRAAFEGTEQET